MRRPTFGKRGLCPGCSTTLPDTAAEEITCPRCAARLWAVRFPSAGLRFLLAQPHRSLHKALLDLLESHQPDIAQSLRYGLENLSADSLDRVELHVELLEELERRLPELGD